MVKINGDASSTVALSLERALNESENQYREQFKNADFQCISSADPQFYFAISGQVTMTARRGFCGNWDFQIHNW